MRKIGLGLLVIAMATCAIVGAQDASPAPVEESKAAAPDAPATDEPTAAAPDPATPGADSKDADLAEAQRLGRALGDFDRSTWELVKACEKPGDACLSAVEQHLAEKRDQIKAVFENATVLRCQVDMGGYVSVRMRSAELGEAFNAAYDAATTAIDGLRRGRVEDPALSSMTARVRSMEKEFRDGICREIVTARGYTGRPKLPTKRLGNAEPVDS